MWERRTKLEGFAAKAINFPLPDEHEALKRWYELVSARPSMAA